MSRDYLVIEQFLKDALQARALQAAFELGVIDALAVQDSIEAPDLLKGRDCDRKGGEFLLQMLVRSRVLERTDHGLTLTHSFRHALQYRDLLTTKLSFSSLVATDYFDSMAQLLRSGEEFMASSRLFEAFDYGRCLEVTTANCMHAARWMQLTTMLSRYEAPACHEHYNFSQHHGMLDVGGNSGEFALQICSREPHLHATVLDLPVVCHVGGRHVQAFPQAERIRFQPANMLDDDFPADCDLITWKSVLHDWPDESVPALLRKSHDALPSGGTVLIFERQRWDFSIEETPYGLLPVLLFFRSYRPLDAYGHMLRDAGFSDVQTSRIDLEVPFLLTTARKC